MKGFLQHYWFLILIVAGGLVVVLRPEWLRWTAGLDPRLVVAAALFLTAWTLESRSLYQTIIRPLPALWGVLVSYGLVPALGWLAGQLLGTDYRIGLMISASVPCTLASAVLWTRLAGGSEATALLVTLLTTCTSWLATTAWLALATGTQVTVDTAAMMRGLVLVLVLPVGLGQLLRAVAPLARTADRIKPAIRVLSRLLILVIMLKAAVDVRNRLDEGAALAAGPLVSTAAACVGTHLAALACGLWSSTWLGFERSCRIAVAFAGSQKTLPVALYLFDAYYKDYPLAVVSLVFYHVGQLIVDTFIADSLARRSPAETELPEEMVV